MAVNSDKALSYYARKFAETLPVELREAAVANAALSANLAAKLKKFVIRQEALEKLRSNGMLLERIPEAHRDFELCVAAISNNGLALQFVPSLLRSRVVKESERYNEKIKKLHSKAARA